MRTITLAIILLFSISLFSQTITISGVLKDADGEPLIGANIIIKGTTTGTVTDFDGKYSIDAPIGSTIVVSAIGMASEEFVVTEGHGTSSPSNKKRKMTSEGLTTICYPQKNKPVFYVEIQPDSTEGGGGSFDEIAKPIKLGVTTNIRRIEGIKKKKNSYVIKGARTRDYNRGSLRVQYSYCVGVSEKTQTPKIQSTYAQGRALDGSINWQGADQGEVYSWGPAVSSLEFDGSSYPYDVNGALVSVGSGNGQSANVYDNTDIYRQGLYQKHNLNLVRRIRNDGIISGGASLEDRNSVIYNSGKKNITLNVNAKDIQIVRGSEITIHTLFNKSEGKLLSHGANLSRIIGDTYSSPITFDNGNTKSGKDAISSESSYLMPDGTQRSYSPAYANNPYGLIATSPDKDDYMHINAGIRHKQWIIDNLRIETEFIYDKQENNSIYGIPTGYAGSVAGIYTDRKSESENYYLCMNPTFQNSYGVFDMKIQVLYLLNNETQTLDKTDRQGLSNIGEPRNVILQPEYNVNMNRVVNSITPKAFFSYADRYSFEIGNTFYYSTTASENSYSNFSPFIGGRVNVDSYIYSYWISNLSTRFMFSRTVQESALIYNDWAYSSTNTSSGMYRSVYERDELFASNLNPEIKTTFDAGIDFRIMDYRHGINFNYFYESINNYVAPMQGTNGFGLLNIADVSNHVFRIKTDSRLVNNNHMYWNMNINWIAEDPVVNRVYGNNSNIPLAGFSNAYSAMAEGEALGTIYGTYYERDINGNMIIGSDGFPIASAGTKALANPNPDWVLGIQNEFNMWGFDLNFVFEWRYGGEVWNGTAAYLDYIGQSTTTERERNIKDYVFTGVNENGSVNTTPVDFYNPALDIGQNRWVRYGAEGVAEDYIEDASSFRLRELTLGYTFSGRNLRVVRGLNLSVVALNLFQITPYSGVDPQSPLFGYSLGQGLDMFNMPSTRSYMFKVLIKI